MQFVRDSFGAEPDEWQVDVLREMGPEIQWVQSYVTGDKIYCIYIAPDEAAVREHATRGGFPANRISAVACLIDPTTAETSVHRDRPPV